MRISIIGTGNVATVMAQFIVAASHQVLHVCGRNEANTRRLADQLQARAIFRPDKLPADADLYIVAVSDQALPAVAADLRIGNKLLVHTAGSVPMQVLAVASRNIGVLYPLQSLRKERVPEFEIPLLVSANSPDSLALLLEFAGSLSPIVRVMEEEERIKMHLAGVVVNNFSNFLITLAQEYCQAEGLSFALLKPLLLETVSRLDQGKAADFQTGPAIRHDKATIGRHMELLNEYPLLQRVYEMFSLAIEARFAASK